MPVAVKRVAVAGDVTLRAVLDQLPLLASRSVPASVRVLAMWALAAAVGLSGRELVVATGAVEPAAVVTEVAAGLATRVFVAAVALAGFATIITRGLPGVTALGRYAQGRAWHLSALVIRQVLPIVVLSVALLLVVAPVALDLLGPVLGLSRGTLVSVTLPAAVLGFGLGALVHTALGSVLRRRGAGTRVVIQFFAYVAWAGVVAALWFGCLEIGAAADLDLGLLAGTTAWVLVPLVLGVAGALASAALGSEDLEGAGVATAWSEWSARGRFPAFRLALRQVTRSADIRSVLGQTVVLVVLATVGLRVVEPGSRELILGHAIVLLAVCLAAPLLVIPTIVGPRPRLGLLTVDDARNDVAVLLAVVLVVLVPTVVTAVTVRAVFGTSAPAERLLLLWLAASGGLLVVVAGRMDGRTLDQSTLGLTLALGYMGVAGAAMVLGAAGLGEEQIPVVMAAVLLPGGVTWWWSRVARPRSVPGRTVPVTQVEGQTW